MPIMIWVAMSPEEKDQAFLAAGFDPNVRTEDCGSDNNTVRFCQDSPADAVGRFGPPHSPGVRHVPEPNMAHGPHVTPQAGDDLRDFQPVSLLTGDNPVTDEMGVAAPASFGVTGITVAGRALRLIMGGGGGRLTAAIWNSLPALVRSILVQAGIGIGALIAFNGDIPFITLPGNGFDPSQEGVGGALDRAVDIQIGGHAMHGAQIIGSWNTNPKHPEDGVTFYRLVGGWLAVQNKKGRWKTWKPKKPIVIYANGAKDLKTLLKADKAVDKQIKKLAKAMNRRAPRPRKAPEPAKPIIIEARGRTIA